MKIKFILTAIALCVFVSIQAQFTSTTASKIATDYQTIWAANAHPRLFGTASEMQRTKDLYIVGDVLVKKTVDQIIAEADLALSKTIPVWGLDAANLLVCYLAIMEPMKRKTSSPICTPTRPAIRISLPITSMPT
jgi:hypothetical protein